jgi:hypothetical protein
VSDAIHKGYLVMLNDDLDYFTQSEHMMEAHVLSIKSALGDEADVQTFVCYAPDADPQIENTALKAKLAEVRTYLSQSTHEFGSSQSGCIACDALNDIEAILDREQKDGE